MRDVARKLACRCLSVCTLVAAARSAQPALDPPALLTHSVLNFLTVVTLLNSLPTCVPNNQVQLVGLALSLLPPRLPPWHQSAAALAPAASTAAGGGGYTLPAA